MDNDRYHFVLKEYYEKAVTEWLNSPIEYFIGPRPPYVAPPPKPWYTKMWQKVTWKLYLGRRWLGYKIAGYNPEHWLDRD